MTDSYSDPQSRDKNSDSSREGRRAGGFRGGRGPGNREGGGFKIRLSDNEMRSARALQEAFNLRSTVAVLGFALRTLGQMLEEGKLNDLVTQYRTQPQQKTGKSEEGANWSRKGRFDRDRNDSRQNENRPDPFARPEKPTPKTSPQEEAVPSSEESLEKSAETSVETQIQEEQLSTNKED